jgi:uncharacterized protein YcfJ
MIAVISAHQILQTANIAKAAAESSWSDLRVADIICRRSIENLRQRHHWRRKEVRIMAESRIAILVGAAGLFLAGCANMNNTQSGALAGTGLGAVAGAIVGEATGHPGAGALIGAATGAAAGGLIGNAEDAKEEKNAAIAHAQFEHDHTQAMARAVTEAEVVNMTRNHVGDSVIINSLRTRGCRWDGTPDAVIRLKHEGVSDQVITAMQGTGLQMAPTVVAAPPPAYYPPPPVSGGVVVVGPGYYGPRYWGPRPYYYGRPYYRRW